MELQVKQEKESNWSVTSSSDWKIRIPRALYDKIFMYTRCIDKEIAGFGDVEVDKEAKEYKITALRMYKQKVTAASVDQDEKMLLDALEQAVLAGDDIKKIRFEWHSHVSMGVFWSGTDETCCKQLCEDSKSFFLFFVVNKKGELLARADYLFQMPEHTIRLTNYCIPVVIEEPVDNTLEEVVKADIAKYIEEPAVVTYPVHHYGRQGYDDDCYLCTYECEFCKTTARKTHWNQDKHCWNCKECHDKLKAEDTEAAKNSKSIWCRCEECDCSAQGRWEKGKWLCFTCIRRAKLDDKLSRDIRSTFQDDRGRHWFWGQCEVCMTETGTTFEEYVTSVKEIKVVMCDQCYSEYETKSKKEGNQVCQDAE